MKKVLLICYVSVMASLVLGFMYDTKNDVDNTVLQYVHTVSVITEDMYDDLILDGWTLENTLTIYTDTVYQLEYEDILENVSILYVKVVPNP